MHLPKLQADGHLPPGIHTATLRAVIAQFGESTPARQNLAQLLELVVLAATQYATAKRVLIWGSFASAKPDPGDLDYSVVVSVDHDVRTISPNHERFFIPIEAKKQYGIDAGFLIIRDFPLEYYIERLDFICHRANGKACGIMEISLRGEKESQHDRK